MADECCRCDRFEMASALTTLRSSAAVTRWGAPGLRRCWPMTPDVVRVSAGERHGAPIVIPPNGPRGAPDLDECRTSLPPAACSATPLASPRPTSSLSHGQAYSTNQTIPASTRSFTATSTHRPEAARDQAREDVCAQEPKGLRDLHQRMAKPARRARPPAHGRVRTEHADDPRQRRAG